jgi:hypothetical protein
VPPEVARAALKMTPAEFWRHVRKLDRLDLLRVGSDDKISLPRRTHTVWATRGPLVDWMVRTWSQRIMAEVADDLSGPDTTFSMRFYRLTAASIADLRAAVRELTHTFGERSLRERLANADSELLPARFLAAVRPGGWFEAP